MKLITRTHAIPKSINTRYQRESTFREGVTNSRSFSSNNSYSYTNNMYNRMSNCWEANHWCSVDGFPFFSNQDN